MGWGACGAPAFKRLRRHSVRTHKALAAADNALWPLGHRPLNDGHKVRGQLVKRIRGPGERTRARGSSCLRHRGEPRLSPQPRRFRRAFLKVFLPFLHVKIVSHEDVEPEVEGDSSEDHCLSHFDLVILQRSENFCFWPKDERNHGGT